MLEKKLLLIDIYCIYILLSTIEKKCTFCIPFNLNNCEKARGVMLQVRKQAEKATCMVGEPRTLHSKITVLSTKKSVLLHKLGFLIHKSYTHLHNYTLV